MRYRREIKKFYRLYSISRPLIGLIVLSVIGTTGAWAASLNCEKAKFEVEKNICATSELLELDRILAMTYRNAVDKAKKSEKDRLRKEQVAWLKARNACKDPLCIEVMYRTRSAMLTPIDSSDSNAASLYGKFWLTYGRGIKVCEAYLERLNHTVSDRHPKCDRPDNSAPGFQMLHRTVLRPEEVQRFWASTSSFIENGEIPDWRRGDDENRKLGLRARFGNTEEQLETIRGESTLNVFRYDEPIDIDNDGIADSIIIWRHGECRRLGPGDKMFYSDSIPIVLNGVGDGPDIERTRLLFGHPAGAYKVNGFPRKQFRPIGRSMGILQFEDQNFIDTFFDDWGDFHDRRRNAPQLSHANPSRYSEDPQIENRLAVFLRTADKTRQLCEYWYQDVTESKNAAK